jgi:hypothetical protein
MNRIRRAATFVFALALLGSALAALGSTTASASDLPTAGRQISGQVAGQISGQVAGSQLANSHWDWCNQYGVGATPGIVWTRIYQATEDNGRLPKDFWTDGTYRADIARVICYESSDEWHAENGPQYGWYQMNIPLINSEGVSWNAYWSGTSTHHAGFWQCTAGELYILGRYGNPAIAWLHERDYGWY